MLKRPLRRLTQLMPMQQASGRRKPAVAFSPVSIVQSQSTRLNTEPGVLAWLWTLDPGLSTPKNRWADAHRPEKMSVSLYKQSKLDLDYGIKNVRCNEVLLLTSALAFLMNDEGVSVHPVRCEAATVVGRLKLTKWRSPKRVILT